jgi:hypothetical protein
LIVADTCEDEGIDACVKIVKLCAISGECDFNITVLRNL